MSDPQPTSKEAKVIKRYTNRKLYDTVESRYVTLEEIGEMVKRGLEVQIVDNRSKGDLTSVTLAQIVFEQEKKKSQMPLDVLREIIRHPGESLTDFYKTEVGPRLDRLLRREDEKKEDGADGAAAAAAAAAAVPPPQPSASGLFTAPKAPPRGLSRRRSMSA